MFDMEQLEEHRIRRNRTRSYGLSLNERVPGYSAPKHSESHFTEFPGWSLGPEFESELSPSTPVERNTVRNYSSQYVSTTTEQMNKNSLPNQSTSNQPMVFNKESIVQGKNMASVFCYVCFCYVFLPGY